MLVFLLFLITSNISVGLLYIRMRQIRIGVNEAKWALGDTNRLDAFCLLLKIKLLFRSSDLKLVSYNKCGALLRMDRCKLKRLLEYGCKVGYFARIVNKKGDVRYVAQKIHNNKQYSYKLRKGDVGDMSFPALKSLVRRIVMENHIRKQEDTFNTHVRGVSGVTMKQIRGARRRESRMLKGEFCENRKGISYERIEGVLNGTMYQATKTIRELMKRGLVRKQNRICKVEIAPEACTATFCYEDCAGSTIVINAKNRGAFVVQSNIYNLLSDNAISLSRHGTKHRRNCNLR